MVLKIVFSETAVKHSFAFQISCSSFVYEKKKQLKATIHIETHCTEKPSSGSTQQKNCIASTKLGKIRPALQEKRTRNLGKRKTALNKVKEVARTKASRPHATQWLKAPGKGMKQSYTRPELRNRLKRKVLKGSKGGKPGQWSARKAQLLAAEYKRAGGSYSRARSKRQKALVQWSREEWTTSDRKPAVRPGGTRRYLPKKAWSKLSPSQKKVTNRKKIQGSRRGRQYVANTRSAKGARKKAHRKSS